MIDTLEKALLALQGDDLEKRADAIEQLGEAQHTPAVPHMLEIVKDCDPGTYYLIVQALGRIADDRAVPTLLQAMRRDDIWVRAAATGALIQIGGDVAIAGLVRGLSDENKAVRRASAKALGKVGVANEDILRGLSGSLLDVDNSVRRFAAEALGRLDGESYVPELAKALADEDPRTRIAAFKALAKIDTPEARDAVHKWSKDQ